MNTQEMTLRERRKTISVKAREVRQAKILQNRRKVAEIWSLDPSEVLIRKELAQMLGMSEPASKVKAVSWGVRMIKQGGNIFYHAPDVREMVAEEARILSEYQQAQREQAERAHQAQLQGRETSAEAED